jgi:hypothetical protein
MLSAEMAADVAWREYVRDLLTNANARGLTSQVIPVCVDGAGLNLIGTTKALRLDKWLEEGDLREVRLIWELTYELARLMRTYIAHTEHPDQAIDELDVYLENARVFLSHSKHDAYGEKIARAIAEFLADSALSQFFDVRDVPPGLPFPDVLERFVQRSAIVAIYTDSYSSREWCRREIIEAKRWDRPLVIADCIDEVDERSFPYLGNVPVVRMEPQAPVRIQYVVARLLDEVFKDYLWSARLAHDGRRSNDNVRFLPRTPELIALSAIGLTAHTSPPTIVYPDPPLGAEELQLFYDIRSDLALASYAEFAAEFGGSP